MQQALTPAERQHLRRQLAAFGNPNVTDAELEESFGPATFYGFAARHFLDLASTMLDKIEEEGTKPMPYVNMICSNCAQNNGGSWPEGHLGSFHYGTCEKCGISQLVTEPRDFRLVSDKDGRLHPAKPVTLHDLYMAEAGIQQGAGG